jgi:DNA-binding NarL/FixJ family response regulator
VRGHQQENEKDSSLKLRNLTEREIQLLKLICTELTYSEIAKEMKISQRTVDGFRESLFEKLKVKSRVGLAMKAIQLGIVQITEKSYG